MIKKLANLKRLSTSTGSGRGNLSISIVNTESCGKRIRISPSLVKSLNNPKRIEVMLNESNTGIYITFSDSGMPLSKGGSIYNSNLVQLLTSAFSLDFSACTSQSFNNVNVLEDDNEKYAEVIINSAVSNNSVDTAVNSSEIKDESNTDSEKEAC